MSIRHLRFAAIIALILAFAAPSIGEEIAGLPLHMEKLGERGIRLWVGDHVSTTAVSALATEKGIVVIDTTDLPSVDKAFRKIIARELGRNDFRYLINTHEHGDHTTGNAVYSDCEIIAHDLVAEGMRRRAEDSARLLDWFRENLPRMETAAADADTGAEAELERERVKISKARFAGLEKGLDLALPTITFSDQMVLDMGDVTLELSYAGGVHTASDIFIFVPEEGLLFTGDTMADVWFTESPGCLAAFRIRRDVAHNFPLLLDNWQALLARRDEIKDLIPGHWNGDVSVEGLEARYNYVKDLWTTIQEANAEGRTLAEVRAELDFEVRFPQLVESPGFTPLNHATSVASVWCDVTGARAASEVLAEDLEQEEIGKAIDEARKSFASGRGEIYFDEGELNALGYRYLREESLDKALAVFQLNTELYPESWNVYDSLAEVLMVRGDSKKAIELYEKSLELNPDNQNGKDMLASIRSGG